jgi:hypothetical protein
MRKLQLLALAAAFVGAATANAGQLLSATYTQTLQGVPIVISSTTATGTLVGNTFRLDAGSWFATNFCIGNPGNAACTPNPAGPFAPPVTRLSVSFNSNGAVSGTTAQANITPATGIMGFVAVKAKIGKTPAFTLLPIVVNAGTGGTATIPDPATSPSPTLLVQLRGDTWHIGQVTQTGLTTDFTALPDAVGTGAVVVTAGGNTEVTLVSLSRTKVRGLANSETSTPTYLKLVYAPSVPEPGTLMLLGAGVSGLVLIGRRKLR